MQPDEFTAGTMLAGPPAPHAYAETAKALAIGLLVVNLVAAGGLFWIVLAHSRAAESLAVSLIYVLFFGCLAQGLAGIAALCLRGARASGVVALLAAPAVGMAAIFGGLAMGGGWGRPLRVRGLQVHPELTRGADWTQGERPDASGLDAATRTALEALWLHDAQKEHASVPAFARISWMLAAVGAPAELLEWSQQAALEEIDHARRCFALAAGYGGRSHSVEAMPELLLAGLDVAGDPLQVLARESLQDGCQLEDFNADVAAACAAACEEPATRAVLQQIAREERAHAEFSWAVLAWTLQRSPAAVRAAIADAESGLDAMARPTAVSGRLRFVVARADARLLLRHGRLPDHQWGKLWDERLARTRARLHALQARSGMVGSLREPTLQNCQTSSHSLRI